MVESHSGFLRDWIDAGSLDVAILFNIRDAEGLEVRPLLTEAMHLISAPSFGVRTGRDRISLSKLSSIDLLMPSQTHMMRKLLDEAATAATGGVFRIKAEIDALSTLKKLVIAGQGHTILPLATVREELESGKVIAHRIERPRLERHLSLVRLSRRPITRAENAITDLIYDLVRTPAS